MPLTNARRSRLAGLLGCTNAHRLGCSADENPSGVTGKSIGGSQGDSGGLRCVAASHIVRPWYNMYVGVRTSGSTTNQPSVPPQPSTRPCIMNGGVCLRWLICRSCVQFTYAHSSRSCADLSVPGLSVHLCACVCAWVCVLCWLLSAKTGITR